MKLSHPFANNLNFLDPKLTEDGKPYGPERYRRIVQECYLISKNMNTSYADVLKMTPIEREYLLQFLLNDFNERKKAVEEELRSIEEKRHK